MNSEYNKELEAEIDRELKALPELKAPPTLVHRVLRTLEKRAATPWYRLAWQYWPGPLRAATLAVLVGCFGGLCFTAWEICQTAGYAELVRALTGWLAGAVAIYHALGTLLAAVVLVVKHLGTVFILACLTALALAWATCLGLGTVYLRLALARR